MIYSVVPPAAASYDKTKVFRLESGKLVVVDNPLSSHIPGIGSNSVDDSAPEEAVKKENTTLSGTSTPPAEAEKKLEEVTGEYREFFRSFGSWLNIAAFVVGCTIWVSIFRGSSELP